MAVLSTIKLTVGDQVSLMITPGDSAFDIQYNNEHFTPFTGWLMKEDLLIKTYFTLSRTQYSKLNNLMRLPIRMMCNNN